MTTTLAERADSIATFYNLPLATTLLALERLELQKGLLLGVSGRLGSGKDTVAPKVLDKLGMDNAVHEYFARFLKEEIDEVIALVKNSTAPTTAYTAVADELTVPYEQARVAVSFIWDAVKAGEVKSSRDRVDSTRLLLQYWGTEVRRAQDDNYWVKRALLPVVQTLAEGKNVFVTDARFPNEIDALSVLGAFTLRLKVSPAVQAQRIHARDGISISESARTHSSETALDSYEAEGRFSLIINTDLVNADQAARMAVAAIRGEGA